MSLGRHWDYSSAIKEEDRGDRTVRRHDGEHTLQTPRKPAGRRDRQAARGQEVRALEPLWSSSWLASERMSAAEEEVACESASDGYERPERLTTAVGARRRPRRLRGSQFEIASHESRTIARPEKRFERTRSFNSRIRSLRAKKQAEISLFYKLNKNNKINIKVITFLKMYWFGMTIRIMIFIADIQN